jgi:hypothetical protein
MIIKNCRICNSKPLQKLFSLGKMKFTGKFHKKNQFIPSGNINLVMCKKCKLIQLKDLHDVIMETGGPSGSITQAIVDAYIKGDEDSQLEQSDQKKINIQLLKKDEKILPETEKIIKEAEF